ncbi:hypothetical protein [Pseudomonas indica]|uniref:hypothetical protein n=1 Tax=Pseudomonas indica TaxID=137658 RepID=UPI000A0180DD|nr:hypothetical protein [Pseudomonas indica]MBU3059229.1 hypothetical protein [Pseudomonas indica]
MLIRKSLAAWVAALFVLCAQITSAQATLLSIPTAQADKIEHGGGCRKDSPPGQCCHAGSQPYHCH